MEDDLEIISKMSKVFDGIGASQEAPEKKYEIRLSDDFEIKNGWILLKNKMLQINSIACVSKNNLINSSGNLYAVNVLIANSEPWIPISEHYNNISARDLEFEAIREAIRNK